MGRLIGYVRYCISCERREGIIVKRLVISLFFVLLLSHAIIIVSGFDLNGIWIGGAIYANISCLDEVKEENDIKIVIDVYVLNDITIDHFNIKIEQFLNTLYSKTIWQNQNLGKDFHYTDTLYITTKDTIFGSDNLKFTIEAQYNDKYWTYTGSPSFIISIVRPSDTYDELLKAYDSLNTNYTSLVSSNLLLEQQYNSLIKTYDNLQNQYNTLAADNLGLSLNLSLAMVNLSYTQYALNQTRYELEQKSSDLNVARSEIAIWQIATAAAFVAGLVAMYAIGKRRFTRKSSSD